MIRKIIYFIIFVIISLALSSCDTSDLPSDSQPESPHEHTIVIDEGKMATCTAAGLTDGQHCSECGEIILSQNEIGMLVHDWDDGIVENAPTCCNVGNKLFNCKNCDATQGQELTIVSHDYTASTPCSMCGAKKPSEGLKYENAIASTGYVVLIGDCSDTEVVIPEFYNGQPVVAVKSMVGNSAMESVYIPSSITSFYSFAFQGCTSLKAVYYSGTLKDWCNLSFETDDSNPLYYSQHLFIDNNDVVSGVLNIPEGTESVNEFAFKNCRYITEIIIPTSVKIIESSAFYDCARVERLVLNEGLQTIGQHAFQGMYLLKSLALPSSIKKIEYAAFSNCTILEKVILGSGIKNVNGFSNCTSLTEIIIPDNATEIGYMAFYGCESLSKVVLGKNTQRLGQAAFYNCKRLEVIQLNEELIEIGDASFYGCNNLLTITIPSNVAIVGKEVFSNCNNLITVNCKMDDEPTAWHPDWKGNSLFDINWNGDIISKPPILNDIVPPEVLSLTINKDTVTVGDNVAVRMLIKDDSKISFVRVWFKMSNGNIGNAKAELEAIGNDYYEGIIEIDNTFLAGECVFYDLQVEDEFRNTTSIMYTDDYSDIKFTVRSAANMNTIKINSGKTLIVAHRGVSGLETENTCAAFVAAGNRSYYGVETDVHLTADGKFAIIHDNNTKRVSGEEYIVESTDFATLSEIRLYERGTTVKRSDLVIPQLSEYATVCRKYGKISVLELKSRFTEDKIAEMIEILRELGQLENTIFISFNIDNCKTVRRLLPDQKVQFLTSYWTDELIQTLVDAKLDVDIEHSQLTKERVDAFHAAGIEVNCWTCDDPVRGEQLVSFGVDYITSNILE